MKSNEKTYGNISKFNRAEHDKETKELRRMKLKMMDIE